jgi:hypothetical protein
MKLPPATSGYSRTDQQDVRFRIEQADRDSHKRNRDVEIGVGRLILTSPNGTRYSITVDNAGVISAVAV